MQNSNVEGHGQGKVGWPTWLSPRSLDQDFTLCTGTVTGLGPIDRERITARRQNFSQRLDCWKLLTLSFMLDKNKYARPVSFDFLPRLAVLT